MLPGLPHDIAGDSPRGLTANLESETDIHETTDSGGAGANGAKKAVGAREATARKLVDTHDTATSSEASGSESESEAQLSTEDVAGSVERHVPLHVRSLSPSAAA